MIYEDFFDFRNHTFFLIVLSATRAVDFNRQYSRDSLLLVFQDPNESCWLTAPTGATTHLRRQLPRLLAYT